jgi:hypothetical protein
MKRIRFDVLEVLCLAAIVLILCVLIAGPTFRTLRAHRRPPAVTVPM